MLADLAECMKIAAKKVYENADLAAVMVGEVISDDPLEIQIEQRLTLEEDQLILSRNVTDYEIDVDFDMKTGTSDGHRHSISGTHTLTVNNALEEGDMVLLIRQNGGQKFVVIDRVVI